MHDVAGSKLDPTRMAAGDFMFPYAVGAVLIDRGCKVYSLLGEGAYARPRRDRMGMKRPRWVTLLNTF